MSAEKNFSECVTCHKNFTHWERTTDCGNCEEGYEFIENDLFPDGHYRKCHSCSGKGEMTFKEKKFCSEDCIEEYLNIPFYNH